MSMKRITIILVQLTVLICLMMVACTFMLYSGTSAQTPVAVAVAAASLLSATGGMHVSGDGGFGPGVSHPIQRPRILNHQHSSRYGADGTGMLEMADDGRGTGSDTGDTADMPNGKNNIVLERYNEFQLKTRQLRDKIQRLTEHNSAIGHHADEAELHAALQPVGQAYANVSTQHVHIFYRAPVPWYEDPEQAGDASRQQQHQRYIRDQDDAAAESANRITVQPLRSVFYPLLGVYSISAKVLDVHFRNVLAAGVGVLVVGWQPTADGSLAMVKHIMNYAWKTCGGRLAVTVEMLPYAGRTVAAVRADVRRLHGEFVWSHPAMYRVHVQGKGGSRLPLVYVRGACASGGADEWAEMLGPGAKETVRGTALDGVFVAEVSTKKDTSTIRRGHLDGFYTRVASNGATYASTWKNWDLLKATADRYRLIFIPTVAPGYSERNHQDAAANKPAPQGAPNNAGGGTKPVDAPLRRHRSNGQYYGVAWRTATAVGARFVSVASYNDWPAGTQIEEAMPYAGHKDYQPTGPRKYLDLTKHWVEEFVRVRVAEAAQSKGAGCVAFFNNTVC